MKQLQPAPGSLVVKARSKDYSNTIGIDAYAMSDVERKVYAAKVPLNDNGFEYPIRQISIDVVKYNIYTGFSYFVKGLVVSELDYSIDLGNLYFTKSIEELVSEKDSEDFLSNALAHEKDSGFEEFLSYALAHEIIESKIYFEIRIVFDVFIPDTTEESNRLALAQATSHTIMDYFNQYVFAETTANSISEITYTETMTFWSTLISAPLVYFGSWAVKGTDKMIGKASIELIKAGEITRGQAIKQMLLQSFASMALSPIKEVFEEIIKDGFTEALAENLVDMAGGTDDFGFWVSSFMTSKRETTGALGQLALGDASVAFGDANLMTKLSLISARISGDANTIAEITASVKQNVAQKQADADAKRQQMKSWQKLFSSGFFKGLLMVLPAVLYGSLSFAALRGLNNMIESTQSAIPKAYARYKSEVQAYRKGRLQKSVGTQDALINNMQDNMKKPADLESAKPDINNEYKALQESGIISPPQTRQIIATNPNPKTESKNDLVDRFNTLVFEDMFKGWVEGAYEDKRFDSIKETIKETGQNYRILGYQETEKQILSTMKTAIKNLGGELAPADQRFFDMWGTSYLDPHIILCGVPKSSVKRGNLEIKEYIIIGTKASKSAMLTHLQEEYGIGPGMSLDMFVLQGDVMAKVPDGTPNVDTWIIDSGLNPATTKIVIVPSTLVNPESDVLAGKGLFNKPDNWEGPSPYWPFFSEFRSDLQNILLRNNIIKDSKLMTVSKMVSDAKYDVLGAYQGYLKRGEKFDFSESDLDQFDKWLAAIEYNLNNLKLDGKITENQYKATSLEIASLFEKMYNIFGLDINSYYHKARIDLNKIFIVLRESGALVNSRLKDFLDYIGRSYRGSGYKDILGASDDIPSLERLRGLKDDLLDAIRKDKTLSIKSKREVIDNCEYILDACIWRTKQYNKLNDELINKLDGKENTMKARLILLIASTHDVLLGLDTFKDLSQLLFREQNYLTNYFLADVKEHGDKGGILRTMLRIQHSVSTWTCKDFDNNINNKELLALKTKVNSIVEKFILMDASNIIYRGGESEKAFKTYTDDFVKDKYIVIRSFWLAFAHFTENPRLSFQDIIRDSAVRIDLQDVLNKGSYKFRIGKNTINTLLSTIDMMYQIELFNIRDRGSMIGSYDKVLAYDEALNDIYKYIGAYYLGYSKKHLQNKDNLEGLINDIREYFVGQHESIQSNPYTLEVDIDIDSLDSLLEYPDLVDHLKRVNILKGFPRSVLDVYSDTTGISSFNKRLVGFSSPAGRKTKAEFIDKTIADKIFTEYKYGESPVPDFLNDLFKNSQGFGKGAGGSISHEVLAVKMQKSQYYIGSEVNVWIQLENDHYRGHIDLLLYDAKTNTIYVCDYKPDLSMSDRGTYSFINSVPQVAGYGLLLQKQGNLKVKSVIFNNKEAWVFDPDSVLDPINEFMRENIEGWYPPWEAFSRYL